MALLGDLQFKVGLQDQNYTQGMSRMQKSTQTFNSVLDGLKTTLLGIFGTAGVMAMVRSSTKNWACLLYTSPSPRDRQKSRMPSSA